MGEWQRSDEIEYPIIWREFSILNPITNEKQSFSIKDIPENIYETVINSLEEHEICSTPIELRREILEDPMSLLEKRASWRMALKQRLSLMCVMKCTDGKQPIVALSINVRRSVYDVEPTFNGQRMRWMRSMQEYIYAKRHFYNDFNVPELIVGMGGFLRSDLTASEVPVEMYQCRGLLCKAVDIRVCIARCVINHGQYLMQEAATKAGFMEYLQVPYEELARLDTTYQLPEFECLKLMYKFYE